MFTIPLQSRVPKHARTNCFFSIAFLFLSFAVLPQVGLAQDTVTGTGITGTVTDNSGGAVPGAQIVVKGSSGEARPANAGGDGVFTMLGLAPGDYDITISFTGFKVVVKKAAVTNGAISKVDAVLEPLNAVGTSVDVTSSTAAQVETGTSDITETITEQEVKEIPLNGRNPVSLIALAPGVSNQTGQDEAKVGVVGSVKYSVNGGRVEYNTFEIDGSDVLNVGINGSSSTLVVYPSVDAISEIKVLSSNYGAMYGRTASGTVLMTTKSGAQQFHGDAYYFGRNEFFNARNFFDETQGAPLYRRHDLGATIGGPVYVLGHYNQDKTKTFFFFSEEYRLEKSPQQYNQAVPSLAERAGDFSDVCPVLGPTFKGTFSRNQYPNCPGYGIPSQLTPLPRNDLTANGGVLDQNAVAILQTGIIPAPNSTSGCNSPISSCYVTTVSPETQWREELFRIDHNFNANTRATFRYVHDSWNTTVTTPQWGTIQNSFPTVENTFIGPGTSLVARLTQTLSPTLVNDFIFSYVNSDITLTDKSGPGANIQRPAALDAPCNNPDPVNTPYQLQCGVGYFFNNGFGGKIPGIVIGGSNSTYGGNGFAVDSSYMPWQHTNPVYTFGDSISKVVGPHNIQAGGQFVLYHRVQTNGPSGAATGDVQGVLTFSNVGNYYTFGNSFADFLYHSPNGPYDGGTIQSVTQDSTQLSYSQRYTTFEPYVQDDWRVTPRLTVNLGLRVSLFGTYRETKGQAYNWEQSAYSPTLASQAYVNPTRGTLNDISTGQPIPLDLSNLDPRLLNGIVHCGSNGVPDSCMQGHLFNPAPRVGFAWDVRGDGKTSLRGGYGIFFEHGTGNESNTGSLEGSSPLVLNITQLHPNGWGCIGSANSGACSPTAPQAPASPAFPLSVTSIPTKAVWPYAQQWSLSLQHELPAHMVATFAYVGSKGTHLTDERQINQLRPVPASQNPYAPGQPFIPQNPGKIDLAGFNQGDCELSQGHFVLQNGVSVNPGDPGYNNLLAACGSYIQLPNIANSLRPFKGFGQIFALENSADSSYNSFQTTLRRVEGPLTLGVSYTFSSNKDNSSDRSTASLINAYDLRANWGRSDYDQRNLLNISYVYQLPFPQLFKHPSDRLQQFVGGWELSGITVYQSGTPFSVINNGGANNISLSDNAGVANGIGALSYPDLVSNPNYAPPPAGNNGKSFGPLLLNPGAFAAPTGLTFGSAGRNVLTNPGRTNFDIALLKHIKITENKNIELRFETFNTFNHTQFRIYNANLGNTGSNTVSCYAGAGSGYSAAGDSSTDCLIGSAFLHPVDAHRPRTIQYGIKFAF